MFLFQRKKRTYKTVTDEERARLLIEQDSMNTHKATDSHVRHFVDFLASNGHQLMEEISDAHLPALLDEFYTKAKPINGETCAIQTLKCIKGRSEQKFQEE